MNTPGTQVLGLRPSTLVQFREVFNMNDHIKPCALKSEVLYQITLKLVMFFIAVIKSSSLIFRR